MASVSAPIKEAASARTLLRGACAQLDCGARRRSALRVDARRPWRCVAGDHFGRYGSARTWRAASVWSGAASGDGGAPRALFLILLGHTSNARA